MYEHVWIYKLVGSEANLGLQLYTTIGTPKNDFAVFLSHLTSTSPVFCTIEMALCGANIKCRSQKQWR